MNRTLSDSAFDEIIQSLPSIHQRANLLTHNVMVQHEIKRLRDQLAEMEAKKTESAEAEVARKAERAHIVAWLLAENQADTVRAAYGRKLAQRLADGEDQK